MSKLFGANWKTSVSQIGVAIFSLLTLLAALPYQLGEISTIIPPEWKARVFTIGAIATAILRVWNGLNQKDKNVTGGTVQQTVSGDVAKPGTQSMVDDTVRATIASGESVTPEQQAAVQKP